MNIPAEPHFAVTPRRRRAPRSASSRHRNYTVPVGRVISLCTTPFLPWKFNDALSPAAGAGRLHRERACGAISSRKLAASLWRLRLCDGGQGLGSGSECGQGNRLGTRVEHSFYGHMKLVGDQEVATVSNVSALHAQLFQAHKRIRELETEQLLCKKKGVSLLKKLGEEKASYQIREREKIGLLVDNLSDELSRERKNYKRIEKLNSTLVSELANAKIQTKKLMQDYEEAKKARELMEEICNELVKEIGEDKAKIGAWVGEALKFQEELEEERKMLKMANAWREERVQMKLADAKLALEDKYCQMNKLVKELEAFLQTKISRPRGATELRRATLIRHAVRSMNIKDIKQLSYVPLESDDMSSIIEELQQGETCKQH